MKTISGKRMCKLLSDRGWTNTRINSSHHTYKSPDGQVHVTVPVHGNKDLKKGMQRGLMKQSGLTDDDL